MKWQPVRNKDYSSRDINQKGECPRFNESATLFIHLSGRQGSKSDLQLTFTPHIKECSLLKEKNDKNTACMLSCPIFEANAKFCQKCGCATGNGNVDYSKRQQEFAGKIYKCPNCGEVLKAFEINCPACGHELRGTKASSAVKEFALKLEAIESRREYEKPRGLFAAAEAQQRISKTDEQKISLIKSFSVPNSKEEMLRGFQKFSRFTKRLNVVIRQIVPLLRLKHFTIVVMKKLESLRKKELSSGLLCLGGCLFSLQCNYSAPLLRVY